MEHAKCISSVTLDGHSLTLDRFVAVARFGARVEISGEAMEAMRASRALAEKIMRDGRAADG